MAFSAEFESAILVYARQLSERESDSAWRIALELIRNWNFEVTADVALHIQYLLYGLMREPFRPCDCDLKLGFRVVSECGFNSDLGARLGESENIGTTSTFDSVVIPLCGASVELSESIDTIQAAAMS